MSTRETREDLSAKKVIRGDEWREKMKNVVVKKEDMNKLIMNYLVTEGYADAARQFSLESGTTLASGQVNEGRSRSGANWRVSSIDDGDAHTSMDVDTDTGAADPAAAAANGTDADAAPTPAEVPTPSTSHAVRTIDARMAVRSHVNRGHIPQAIDLLNDLDPMLLEEKDDVYFRLQQQQLIELIREEKVEEAIEFAENYLAPRGEDNPMLLAELERTITLLAFDAPLRSPLRPLMLVSHRQVTASEVNAAILGGSSGGGIGGGSGRGTGGKGGGSGTDDAAPRISVLLRMLVWAQKQLHEVHNCVFPMVDDIMLGNALDSAMRMDVLESEDEKGELNARKMNTTATTTTNPPASTTLPRTANTTTMTSQRDDLNQPTTTNNDDAIRLRQSAILLASQRVSSIAEQHRQNLDDLVAIGEYRRNAVERAESIIQTAQTDGTNRMITSATNTIATTANVNTDTNIDITTAPPTTFGRRAAMTVVDHDDEEEEDDSEDDEEGDDDDDDDDDDDNEEGDDDDDDDDDDEDDDLLEPDPDAETEQYEDEDDEEDEGMRDVANPRTTTTAARASRRPNV